jgi:hypothetical protein
LSIGAMMTWGALVAYTFKLPNAPHRGVGKVIGCTKEISYSALVSTIPISAKHK